MDFLKQFENNWTKNGFPSSKEKLLVAVSGGKDSMALVAVLHFLGFEIAIAHCNFQLRGDDSEQDQKLVENWGKEHNIVVHTIRFDTEMEMQIQKKGVQETARNLRYSWFQELCKQNDYGSIATAHHANDNAETMLINFLKGTGIAGLHGIPLKNKNIIRPLLFATRQSIDAYVHENKVPYREDKSNESTKYLRNSVRHKIIPQLNEIFNDVVPTINENSKKLKDVEILYRQAIELHKKQLLLQRGADIYIPILKLKKLAAYETICFEIFSEFGFNAAQVKEILKLLNSESGHFVPSQTHKVIRDRMFFIITLNDDASTDLIVVNKLPQTIKTKDGDFIISIGENKGQKSVLADFATLNADKITLPIILRPYRMGDYFYPLGMGMKKKKVSRFLIDQKVPIHKKEKIWVLEHDKKIIWIAGMRIDERYKLKDDTQKVLEIEFLKN